ncbi:retrovirus-related pol polyprotein from transposon TNT 1-94 [Tanacetum coccineum]
MLTFRQQISYFKGYLKTSTLSSIITLKQKTFGIMRRCSWKLNSKFMNNMLLEWGGFVTAVKLNRGLRDSNYDQMVDRIEVRGTMQGVHVQVVMGELRTELGMQIQVKQGKLSATTALDRPHGKELHSVQATTKLRILQRQDVADASSGEWAYDCNAFDSDVDEAPTTQTMFMANLSSADLVYDEVSPSYDLDILSEVPDHDNYQDVVCEHHEVHEMRDDVQPNYVVDSHADYTSDSNMIPYDQYVKDNSAQCVSVTTQNNVVDKSLTVELATYKEQVELYKRRAKFELTEREQNIDEQLRIVITDRNIEEENLKRELHSIKLQLNSTINHNKSMVNIVTSLKKDFKQKENKYLKEFLDMKALKEKVEDILFKQDQSLQTVHMLCKPKPHYDKQKKDLLKMKAKALKEQTPASRPIKALMVYPPNIPATLVPRALTKEIKEMKEIFEELKAEVDQNIVNRRYDEIERKNLLIENDNLIVDCLSKELKYQHLKESFGNNKSLPARDAPDFDLVFVIEKMKASIQGKDNAIKKLRMQISRLQETRSEANRTLDFRALDFQITQLTKKVIVLQEQNELFRAENEKVKQHYKELYDSIKIMRAKHIKQTTALLTKNENLKVQIKDKMKCVTIDYVKPKVLAHGMYAIDVEPIPPRCKNNREAHLDYLKHLKESVKPLCEIVEEARLERPLDRSLASACLYIKQSPELLEYMIGTCPKDFNKHDNKHVTTPLNRRKRVTFEDQCEASNNNTHKHVEQLNIQKTNVPVIPSTRINTCIDVSGSQPRSNTKSDNKKQVEEHPGTNKSSRAPTKIEDPTFQTLHLRLFSNAGRTYLPLVLDSGCSKHMTGDRSWLRNFVKKFIGTVRFGNDHFGTIMGYGDYVIGDSVISRVYYVEGLGHNLFSVKQFCDSDLEVAFRKHSYIMKSSLICLLSKASKNKSWLWHRRLNHLNFSTINDLARKDLVRGLPRLKFEKDHLCSACQLGKSKKHTHTPKTKNTNLEVLNTLYMDLCGPMRVIFLQKSVPRTPQQNDIVERRNRTLMEAARTMLIFSKALMFLWAEDVANACYTQNQSLIHTRHNKTPYELVHDNKPDLTFFRVFGALCYPTNDSEDLGKLQPTADIGIFVDRLVSWSSKKQKRTAISTTEAEYIAMPLLSATTMSITLGPSTLTYDTISFESKLKRAWLNYNMANENVPAPALTRSDDQILLFAAWTGNYSFQLDEARFVLDVNLLREALEITPIDQAYQFVSPPLGDAIMDFVNELGYTEEIHFVSRMAVNNLYQPWRAICHMLNHVSQARLWFVPKGKDNEVFGIPIPNELITNNIKNAPYYNAYLEMVAKHDQKIATKKGGKKKPATGKQLKPKPVKEKSSKPAPAPKLKSHDSPSICGCETSADTGQDRQWRWMTEILQIGEEQSEDVANMMNLEEKTTEIDEGQARSDPGKTPESRPPLDDDKMDEYQARLDPGESQDPQISSETLSLMKNLDDAYTIGDQFLNDKSTEDEPRTLNVEAEVVSMVTVPIHQADLPEADMKEMLHQQMFESGSYKSHSEHIALYEALKAYMERAQKDEFLTEKDKSRKRRHDDQYPLSPPPKDTNQNKKRRHTSDASVEDVPMPDTAHMSDSEDTDSVYLPKIKLRPDWLKPVPEEDKPASPKPDWVLPLNDLPETENN